MSTKFKQKKRVLSSILEAKKGKWERHIETLGDGNETLAKFAKTSKLSTPSSITATVNK